MVLFVLKRDRYAICLAVLDALSDGPLRKYSIMQKANLNFTQMRGLLTCLISDDLIMERISTTDDVVTYALTSTGHDLIGCIKSLYRIAPNLCNYHEASK